MRPGTSRFVVKQQWIQVTAGCALQGIFAMDSPKHKYELHDHHSKIGYAFPDTVMFAVAAKWRGCTLSLSTAGSPMSIKHCLCLDIPSCHVFEHCWLQRKQSYKLALSSVNLSFAFNIHHLHTYYNWHGHSDSQLHHL